MPLTGRLLIALMICGTVIVLAATVWSWSRTGWMRFVVRPTGVLLTESLLLVSVGLIVNRQQGFYPSWPALFETTNTGQQSYQTNPGSLDGALATRAAGHESVPQLLPWQPSGWTDWRLASAPTLVIPTGYSEHPQWRYSVVLVIAKSDAGWPAAWQQAAGPADAAGASRDVVILVTPTPATVLPDLLTGLTNGLHHDLRVTDHRWAIVTSQPEAEKVHAAALPIPGLFPALATVQTGTSPAPATKKPLPNTLTKKPAPKARSPKTTQPKLGSPQESTAESVALLGASDASAKQFGATAVPDGVATFAVRVAELPTGFSKALITALTWAATQTPPPLAASSVPVKTLPITKHPNTTASSSSLGAPVPLPAEGRIHGPGQPQH